MFETNKIRAMFPMYKHQPDLVYLDNSATSLKPQVVLDKMNEYYSQYGVNIHRGVYKLSYQATEEYEIARIKVAKFINAKYEEVVFTKSTSDGLNLVALTYGDKFLNPGDVVITSELEHHSSVLPWMKLCEKKQASLRYVPLNDEGRITIENFKKVMDSKVKVVALTYVSNVLGYITPIEEIIKIAHEYGSIVIVDAAQAAPHFKVDVKKLDCDFLAFSAHKMLGPTGIGVLFGKTKFLKKLDPLMYGGDMNHEVTKENVEVKEIPYRFEAGTPAIAEILGLGRAVDFIDEIGIDNIKEHSDKLHQYALQKLEGIRGLTIYNKTAELGIISFNIDGVHPHDAATLFDEENICIRAGHHCAQLVSKWLNCIGTLRASFYLYNTYEDVDKFVNVIKKSISFFRELEGELYE